MQTCPSFLVLGGTSSKETGDGTHLKRENLAQVKIMKAGQTVKEGKQQKWEVI